MVGEEREAHSARLTDAGVPRAWFAFSSGFTLITLAFPLRANAMPRYQILLLAAELTACETEHENIAHVIAEQATRGADPQLQTGEVSPVR